MVYSNRLYPEGVDNLCILSFKSHTIFVYVFPKHTLTQDLSARVDLNSDSRKHGKEEKKWDREGKKVIKRCVSMSRLPV